MTHLMQGMMFVQQPHALRRAVAVVLRALSKAFDAVAARLEYTRQEQHQPMRAVVEFGTVEFDGRMVGAYYVDGELVTIVPDVTRF